MSIRGPGIGRGSKAKSISTMFKLVQKGRKDMTEGHKQALSEVSQIIGANLSGSGADSIPTIGADRSFDSLQSNRSLPFSVFSVKFSVLSTTVVLGFLESRLPGVMFFMYKRDNGIPPLDSTVFGPYAPMICKHPLAMKVKGDSSRAVPPSLTDEDALPTSSTAATCLVGFDLRMVKDFSARPTMSEDGAACFRLDGPSMEKVSSWWVARHPINDRVKMFMGLDPKADVIDMPLFSRTLTVVTPNDLKLDADTVFKEGGKKPITNPMTQKKRTVGEQVSSANNTTSSLMATKTAIARASYQPDLKNPELLLKARAVVVDLGNACWTHRHFSEDIQTRQYRSPEVLIGSRYDTSADIWSLGCITFELLTGDLLFDPRAGEDYDRDEDHLAMFQELLGKMPKKFAVSGKYSKNFFDRKGNLKHIKALKFWPIQEVLHEKYHFSREDAEAIASFMLPLLEFDPKNRATALDCLKGDWLKDIYAERKR